MEARPVSESRVQMTQMVLPTHTNSLDTVFGGQIMAWIDIAAAIAAQRHCRKPVVTASMDSMSFLAPVYTGWIVNLKASVNYVGKTSLEVGVRVDGESPIHNEHVHTSSAYLTFVCLDSHGKPTKVPPLILETDEDERRNKSAIERRASRLALREALKK